MDFIPLCQWSDEKARKIHTRIHKQFAEKNDYESVELLCRLEEEFTNLNWSETDSFLKLVALSHYRCLPRDNHSVFRVELISRNPDRKKNASVQTDRLEEVDDWSSIEGGRAGGKHPLTSTSPEVQIKRTANSASAITNRVLQKKPEEAAELFQGVTADEKELVWSSLSPEIRLAVWEHTRVSDKAKTVRQVSLSSCQEMLSLMEPKPRAIVLVDTDTQTPLDTPRFIPAFPQLKPTTERAIPHAPRKPDETTIRFAIQQGTDKQAIWSRIVASIPDAEFKNCKHTHDGLIVKLGSTEQAAKLRATTGIVGAEMLPPPCRKYRVVLANFDSHAIIETDLKSHFAEKLTKITALKSKFSTRGDQWLLELTDYDTAVSLVKDGSKMAPFMLRFRWFVVRPSADQCFRCQGFNHLARDCSKTPRCARCGKGHDLKACTIEQAAATCCNCQGAHAANWARCPARPPPS